MQPFHALRQSLTNLCIMIGLACSAPSVQAADITIFAAASLTSALTDATQRFEKKTGVTIRTSYASSSSLARQIEAGAPTDLFFSANLKWMDYLVQHKLVSKEHQDRSLSNQLVLVAPKHLNRQPFSTLPDHAAISKLLGTYGRMAIGDPDHVPLGIYGKAVLEQANLWSLLRQRIARTDNARAALALTEQGETPLGLLYRTDATLSDKLDILYIFPRNESGIRYALALTPSAPSKARDFFSFLISEEGKDLFVKHGFSIASSPQ